MNIEARLNSVHIKESCVSCGLWDRPLEVAYFDEHGGWFCDKCVEDGAKVIRENFREAARSHRERACDYDKAAEGLIDILPVSEEVKLEAERIEAEWRREEIRYENSPHHSSDHDLPYLPF